MKHIKRIDEFFDNEDLAAKYEIPHLKGEMDFRDLPLSKEGEEDSNSFYRKLLVKFPILGRFHQDATEIYGVDMHAPYATSYEPVGGITHYAQIGVFYHEGLYSIDTVTRNLEDYDKQERWEHDSFDFSHIDDAYKAVAKFLKKCEALKIIKPGDRTNYQEN